MGTRLKISQTNLEKKTITFLSPILLLFSLCSYRSPRKNKIFIEHHEVQDAGYSEVK